MKTIAFSSIKGGTGKSSNAIIQANYLAKAGKRILCIDLDIQNSMTFYYSEEPNLVESCSISEALHQGNIEGNIIETIHPNINLIPSSFNLVNLRTISILALRRLLNQVSDDYDYCIIDTAPTWDNITQNALFAADLIVTPVNLSQWDWKGALFFQNQVAQDLGEDHLGKWHILINAWKPPRTANPNNLTNQLLDLFNGSFENILKVRIPNDSLIKKYIDTGECLTMAKDKSRLFMASEELSQELTGELLNVEVF